VQYLAIGNDLFPISDSLDTEEIKLQLDAVNPKAIIPPYDLMSETYTARCAEWAKNNFPDRDVGVVIPTVHRPRAIQLIRLFQRSDYRPIIFHQNFPIIPWLPSMKRHLNDDQWYHLCGIDELAFVGVPGKWTKGDLL